MFLGLNLRSLRILQDELELLFDTLEHKPAVLALTETWVAENDSIEEYNIEGYQTIESNP